MRRLLVSAPIALVVLLALLPASSRAVTTNCGVLKGTLIEQGGKTFQQYVRVEVAQGGVSCSAAEDVIGAYESGDPNLLRGWHCTIGFDGPNVEDECRGKGSLVDGIEIFVPRPASTPGEFSCAKVIGSDGVTTATDISTDQDTCTHARQVAGEFINAPACAISFHSSHDYDCIEGDYGRAYHCTGTIETARESSIACYYDGKDDGFTFDLID
jgi:hypothetical protein